MKSERTSQSQDHAMSPDLRARFLDAWAALGEVALEALAAQVPRQGGPTTDVATGRNNPYRSKTLFLQAAARGDFPTFAVGRAVGALWPDVVQAMKARPLPVRRKKVAPPGPAAVDDARARDLEVLRQAGVVAPSVTRPRRRVMTG